MTLRYVIDCGVAIKWFLPEEDSDRALHLHDALTSGECELLAPDLLLIEFANVLWKRRAELDQSTSSEMIHDLLDLDLTITPSQNLLAAALDVARSHNCTVYDSLYLALAATNSIELITADAKLYRSIKERLQFVRLLNEFTLPAQPIVSPTEA